LFHHKRLQEIEDESQEEHATFSYVDQAKKKTEELLAHITSMITNQHEIWGSYAKFHEGFRNKEKVRVTQLLLVVPFAKICSTPQALDCRLKQMRAASPTDWQTDEKKFQTVSDVSLLLIDTYLMQDEQGLKKNLYSAKLHLRGVLKKAEVHPLSSVCSSHNNVLSSGQLEGHQTLWQASRKAHSYSC